MILISEVCGTSYFYPRPPRGGRRSGRGRNTDRRSYFYPRPPRGGRHPVLELCIQQIRFLSTPSARRATSRPRQTARPSMNFYPRPPRGGRRGENGSTVTMEYFYPRPPRGGRPAKLVQDDLGRNISIHALREEGDGSCSLCSTLPRNFYPRPPRGGRQESGDRKPVPGYFYPRPPRGGRPGRSFPASRSRRFLSTPSARRATTVSGNTIQAGKFLSTPSARRATAWPKRNAVRCHNFYPRPPRGGRLHAPGEQHIDRIISIHALREEGDAGTGGGRP